MDYRGKYYTGKIWIIEGSTGKYYTGIIWIVEESTTQLKYG